MSLKITLPDGSQMDVPEGITIIDVASKIGKRLANDAVAGKVDGKLVDLTTKLQDNVDLEIITVDSDEGREIYRHTASHVMAQAVKRLFPETELTIGPAIEDGFYYDFDSPRPFVPEDLEKIEAEMQKIINEDLPVERLVVPKDEAIELFKKRNEGYKIELLNEIEDNSVSLYKQGEFFDLCEGPHLSSTGKLRVFKLLNIAGAYWRGDENNPMLQRIYGTAFSKKSELDNYLETIEEAKERDHRKLGPELDLYTIHEQEAGPGLVYWHPKGAILRRVVEDFWKDVHLKNGYELVDTPHIARADLWQTSGHYDYYLENMYTMEVGGQDYVLKPMNCPGHILIYNTHTRSYRDLPVRYAELGTVYRYEKSGTLHGLLRVRGFTQDDAHIFCTPDQLISEIVGVLDLMDYMLKSFGYDEYEIDLSVRDPEHKENYLGNDEEWERAENALVQALTQRKLSYKRMEGEAVFYGPKIDVKLVDALGRSWQGPTIQFDFNLPARFDVNYVGQDGKEHHVFMVHRVVLGAIERFVGGLVEHYGGAFPTWLSPVQVKILTITDEQINYAMQVRDRLESEGLRVETDTRNEKLGFKIREAQLEKVPYMLIVGEREVENSTVSVRLRSEEELGAMEIGDFIERVATEIAEKK